MSTMTLVQRNGSAEGVNPWLTKTVQQFFQNVNWDNQTQPQAKAPAQSQSSSTATPSLANAGPLDLTLNVNQFFGAIAWEGTPAIAAHPPVEESQSSQSATPEKSVTLDDFFGSF